MNKEDFLKLGYHIKFKRDLKNLSQEQLSEKSEVSVRAISDLECGKGNMTIRNLYKVAQVLVIDLGVLTNPGI